MYTIEIDIITGQITFKSSFTPEQYISTKEQLVKAIALLEERLNVELNSLESNH